MAKPVKSPDTRFAMWLAEAPKGNTHEYHRGFLPRDRSDFAGLARAADFAAAAADSGNVALVQKRNGFLDYSYLAVRC